MQAVIDTARTGKETLERLYDLKQEHDQIVLGMGRRVENGAKLLAYLYDNPVISVTETAQALDLSRNTLRALVDSFVAEGLLREITNRERDRLFEFPGYLSAFRIEKLET